MTYKQFPLMYLWSSIITMVIFVTVPCAVGDDGAAGCPAGCSCSTVDGFVDGREVKCSYLGLSDIPSMLNSFTVHTLDLSNNEISILKNASFSSYSSLFTLILSYSKVEEIEINAFDGLRKMRDIDLSYNKLQSFNPEIFSSNPVLETVSLRGNNLVYLSSDFPILMSTSISSLDLSFCSLTKIYSVTFCSLPSLYDLDLSSNNLQTISLRILEKVPDLRWLELNNNRWTCNCDIVEVMQWAYSKRGQQPAHKPVKCLEGKQYRPLWTMARGNRSCSESKTTEPVVEREREFTTDVAVDLPITSIAPQVKALPSTTSQRVIENAVTSEAVARNSEFTTDMAVDLPIISVGIAQPIKASPGMTLQRVIENEVTLEGELRPAPENETRGWASLLSWNVNTLTVFVILPVTLGVAVFVSLIGVNYVMKRGKDRRTQHDTQEKYNHFTAFISNVPLLKTHLTADITKQHAGHENRSSYGVGGTEYHVYERID